MPADYKATFFFTQGKYGWSETLYINRASHVTAMNSAKLLIPHRRLLLGGDNGDGIPYLAQIRVSDIKILRDSVVYAVPFLDGINREAVSTADNPNLALLTRLDADPNFRRQLYLRGQPDTLIANNGRYTPTAMWNNLVETWLEEIKEKAWSLLVTDRPTPKNIIAVGAEGVMVKITSDGVHNLTSGNTIRLWGLNGVTMLRGNWVVQVLTDSTFALIGSLALNYPLSAYLGGGFFYQRVPALKPITSGKILRATHRITGGPFDRPLGRRPRKKKV